MPTPAENPADKKQETPNQEEPAAEKVSSVFEVRLSLGRRKRYRLPQVAGMALEGRTYGEIAKILGLPKTTVYRWLQELKRDRQAKAADRAEMAVEAIARYEAIYFEAMEAWRRSKTLDKSVRCVEDTVPNMATGARASQKTLTRTEDRTGEVAFLAQARGAVDAICKVMAREPFEDRPARPAGDSQAETVTGHVGRNGAGQRQAASDNGNGKHVVPAPLPRRERFAAPWNKAEMSDKKGNDNPAESDGNGTK